MGCTMEHFLEKRTVAPDEVEQANCANWDDRAAIHEKAYGLEQYIANKELISVEIEHDAPIIQRYLQKDSLKDVSIIHLQCHLGTDTVSLARLGASVTGLDFSPASLQIAKEFAQQAHTQVTWVQANVLEAAQCIHTTFDVVYTSVGTIVWFEDLKRWACQIYQLLKPGGIFFIRDGHPMLLAVDEHGETPVLKYDYFPSGKAHCWHDETSYVGDGVINHSRSYEFAHSLSEIIMALIDAGLELLLFDEGKELPWEFSALMTKNDRGHYEWPESLRYVIPCTFTIVARKPLS